MVPAEKKVNGVDPDNVSVSSTPGSGPPSLHLTTRPSSYIDAKQSSSICPFISEQHVGREVINCLIDCPPQKIYELLFIEPKFMLKIYNDQNYNEVASSAWENDTGSGNLKRTVTFVATLPSNVLGPSTCNVTEEQTAFSVNRENELYVVNTETTNAGIPYADNFKINTHYCITKAQPETIGGAVASRLTFFCTVNFKKGTLFFIKNLIEKNALNGCETIGHCILSSVMREVKGESVPIRKRKRATNKNSSATTNRQKNSGICGTLLTLWLLLMLIIAAGIVNMHLYTRLNHLEASTYRDWIWRKQTSMVPGDLITDELDKLLEDGELFYSKHVRVWEEQLLHTIDALDKIEDSMKKILETVPTMKKHSQSLAHFRKMHDKDPTRPLEVSKEAILSNDPD